MLSKAVSFLITSVCTNVVQETPGTVTYSLWFKVWSVRSTADSVDRHAAAVVATAHILFVHDVYCWAWLCGLEHTVNFELLLQTPMLYIYVNYTQYNFIWFRLCIAKKTVTVSLITQILQAVTYMRFQGHSQSSEKRLLALSHVSVCLSVSLSFRLSVCLSARNNSALSGRIFNTFDIRIFFDNL